MRRAILPLLLLFGCGGSGSVSGQQLPAGALGSPAAKASFGQSVAIVGDEVAIGAPAEDGGARDAGRVHVFDRFDGTHLRTLTSPAPIAAGRFGAAMAADAGRILVGEPGRGRAHLLDAATGALLATFSGPGDFGRAVALGGGFLCVGSPSRGEVHVFDADLGTLVRVLTRPGGLGGSLAFAGGRLLSGAPSAGRAYVFDPATGQEILSLSGPGDFGAAVAAANGSWLVAAPAAMRVLLHDGAGALVRAFLAPGFADAFGTGVAWDDGHVIVGGVGGGVPSLFLFDPATGELLRTIQSASSNEGLSFTALSGVALLGLFPTGTSPRPGVAQTYSCDSGGLLQTFESPGDVPQGALGTSVAFLQLNGLVAVGAPGEGTGGLVRIFSPDGALVRTLASPSPQSIGGFGTALAVSGMTIAVGAPGEAGGRVHVFDATDGTHLRTLAPGSATVGFGSALAIDAATIYVGSPGDTVLVGPTGFAGAGRVHAFVLGTGAAGPIHTSPNPATQGRFGAAVDGDGGQLLVGAPGEASGQGAAYLLQSGGAVVHTLSGSQGNAGSFGAGVAMTPTELWVGAPDEDFILGQQGEVAAGAVHVFDRQGGTSVTVLRSSSFPTAGFRFGAALDADSGFVAIGAPGEPASPVQSPGGGVVHQYEAATRIRLRKFVSPQQGANAGGFGASVAIGPIRLAVGAPLEDRGAAAPNAGFAYLFNLDAIASLRSPQATDAGLFGWDAAVLDADTVVIGAPTEISGNVYLIDPAGAQQPVTIPAPDQQGFNFGWSVAVANGNIVVGAPGANLGAGEAYLFGPTGTLLQAFQSPDGSAVEFGDEVAGVGSNVLVGSPLEVVNDVSNVGRAYLFAPDGTLLQTYDSPNGEADGKFGSSVAALGADVLIGAPGENGSAGRAYLFSTSGTLLRTFDGASVGGGRFGSSVGAVGAGILAGSALEVAVGAPGTLAGGTVTTFDPATGAVTGTAENPEGFQSEFVGFGEAFADVNGTLAVGSPFGGFTRGRVHLFGPGGQSLGFIESPNAQVGGAFGETVVAYNGSLLVGSPFEDVNPAAAGRAYVLGLAGQTGPPQPDATFVSPSPTPGGVFGTSVSFAGGAPVAGAPGEDVVYVFDPQTLQPDDALEAPNPVSGAQFGAAVAANFLQITVGEPGGAGGAGRAYLFDATTRLLSLTFDTTFPEQGGLFGASVAVTGANAVVGAPGESGASVAGSGRAYYFDCLVETVLQVFESPNPVASGRFGCAVATAGFDVYVGACDEGPGNVYGFFGLSGAALGTFPHPEPQSGARFGAALAMLGTDILVGAPQQNLGQAGDAGVVYLIDTATGQTLLTLAKPNPVAGDLFGSSVAAVGSRIFVGAPGAQNGAGEVWEFDASSASVIASYVSANPEAGGGFGSSVAAIPQNLLVGAPLEDGGDADAGVAYLNPPPQ